MFRNPLKTHGKIVQNGREVYKWAARTIPIGIKELLRQADLQLDDLMQSYRASKSITVLLPIHFLI